MEILRLKSSVKLKPELKIPFKNKTVLFKRKIYILLISEVLYTKFSVYFIRIS